MSLLKSVFKIPTKAQIGFLKLDASFSESHKRTARVTDNEVEDGSIISDHIKLDPKSLSMEAVISDTPISILGLGVSTDDFLGKSLDFINSEQPKNDTNAPLTKYDTLVKNQTRTPQEAWLYLNALMEKRTPFSIVTSLQRYENMVLTSLTAPRSAENGKDLKFNAELRQIQIVASSVVQIPAFKVEPGGAANSASSKGKLGKQSTKEATVTQKDNSSLFLKVFKKVGIF